VLAPSHGVSMKLKKRWLHFVNPGSPPTSQVRAHGLAFLPSLPTTTGRLKGIMMASTHPTSSWDVSRARCLVLAGGSPGKPPGLFRSLNGGILDSVAAM